MWGGGVGAPARAVVSFGSFFFSFLQRSLRTIARLSPPSRDELDCSFSPFCSRGPMRPATTFFFFFFSLLRGARDRQSSSGHTHSAVAPDNAPSPSSGKFIFPGLSCRCYCGSRRPSDWCVAVIVIVAVGRSGGGSAAGLLTCIKPRVVSC